MQNILNKEQQRGILIPRQSGKQYSLDKILKADMPNRKIKYNPDYPSEENRLTGASYYIWLNALEREIGRPLTDYTSSFNRSLTSICVLNAITYGWKK